MTVSIKHFICSSWALYYILICIFLLLFLINTHWVLYLDEKPLYTYLYKLQTFTKYVRLTGAFWWSTSIFKVMIAKAKKKYLWLLIKPPKWCAQVFINLTSRVAKWLLCVLGLLHFMLMKMNELNWIDFWPGSSCSSVSSSKSSFAKGLLRNHLRLTDQQTNQHTNSQTNRCTDGHILL